MAPDLPLIKSHPFPITALIAIWLPLICFALVVTPQTAQARSCHGPALSELKRLSPDGFAVYANYPDKSFFLRWIDNCRDLVGGLATAVHETVHMLTEHVDGYPLIGGGKVARVPESRVFFPPMLIASRFSRRSPFVQSYLMRGGASSADYLRYLLDELNAYTHDLNTTIMLRPLERGSPRAFHRDGLASLMAFVATYVDVAGKRRPRTWSALMRPQARATVTTLWNEAERVMRRSCHVRGLGYEAPQFLGAICAMSPRDPLSKLLGRPPVCPLLCAIEESSLRIQ